MYMAISRSAGKTSVITVLIMTLRLTHVFQRKIMMDENLARAREAYRDKNRQ